MTVYKSIYPDVPLIETSLFTHILPANDRFPANFPAFIDAETGTIITRADLRSLSLSLAWGLRNEFAAIGGVPLVRGDTVMLFSPNSIAWPLMSHGSVAAGLRVTMVNSGYSARELAHQWTDSRAKAVFVHPSLLPVVLEMFKLTKVDESQAKKKIILAAWAAEDKGPQGFIQMDQLLGKGKLPQEEQFTGAQIHETVYLCYSSGTTGLPKGVETTHQNLTTVTQIVPSAMSSAMVHGKDVLLAILPFFHIYGAVKLLTFPLTLGVPVVIMPRFDPEAFCRNIEGYRITVSLVVPPVLVVMSRHPAVEKYDMKTLRTMMSGAAPLGAPLAKAVIDRLKSLGADVVITQGYGLTETSPTTHLLPAEHALQHIGSVGPLLPNLQARLVAEGDKDVPEGEPGELWIKGPSVMKGYLNNPKATQNAITPDGWFKTGDVCIIRNNYYTIVDRQKELIKYKGFQVPPAELESLLLQHPEIADAGVTAVDSPAEATELPRAYVVHAKGLPTPEERTAFGKAVQKWIEERVARHKFLRGGVVVVDAIPKSAAGKIFRRQLRDRANKEILAEMGPVKGKL